MLYTTFALAHKTNACQESYKKMAQALGGVNHYGKDTPIPLDKILEVCGLSDAIWASRCTTESSREFIIKLSCRYAEHVLHYYEDKYPDDNRPRQAIIAARRCITDKSTAAWAAAGAAARAAARAAAEDAAGAAAWAARAAAGAAAGAAAWAARAAARAAAEDAAWAAWAAAEDAAWATEQRWQEEQFLALLNES